MSETPGTPTTQTDEKPEIKPPQDLPLNLDLYNYDSPDAQSCPYVLTSPRSLEACSRVGIKPVDLLHKTLAEFSNDVESGKPLEEIVKLYDEYEQHRIILLQKCQAERDFIIWRSTSKRRSHSLSPCRRNKLYSQHRTKDCLPTSASHPQNAFRKSSEDILLSPDTPDGRQSRLSSRHPQSSVKNRAQRPTSWSTPASPYYRGSKNLFVRITSPVVCAKLQNFPKAKMRLPPKKYEKQEEEAERRARAQRAWDKEKEDRERRKELAELERWKNLAVKQKRSSSEEVTNNPGVDVFLRYKHICVNCHKFSLAEELFHESNQVLASSFISYIWLKHSSGKEKNVSNHSCTKHLDSPNEEGTKTPTLLWKRHSFKCVRNLGQAKSFDESVKPKQMIAAERMSRFETEQKLRAIQAKEERFEKRKQEILHRRDSIMKRNDGVASSAQMPLAMLLARNTRGPMGEELREKIKQVKLNQQELDKAMEQWQEQVLSYQYSANVRAAEKVAEIFEQRRQKVKQERLSKEAEHKRKMQKIEAEDFAKLQEMMAKLRSKDERCRAFTQEKHSSIEQSRQLAQAASDLRDLIRQRLDKDSFLKKSQHAMLESRLQQKEPRLSLPKKQDNSEDC